MNVLKRLMIIAVMLMGSQGLAHAATGSSTAVPQVGTHVAGGKLQVRQGPHDLRRWQALHAVLNKLNLTEAQQGQIKTLLEQVHRQHESLINGERANWLALLAADPVSPDYAALLATQKANMTALVQLRSDTWVRVFGLLTADQQASVPAIVRELQNQPSLMSVPAADKPAR